MTTTPGEPVTDEDIETTGIAGGSDAGSAPATDPDSADAPATDPDSADAPATDPDSSDAPATDPDSSDSADGSDA